MKNKNLENLFREKLGNLSIEPSADAHDRFDGLVTNGRRKILVRRISVAAGILLLFSAGLLLFEMGNSRKNITGESNGSAPETLLQAEETGKGGVEQPEIDSTRASALSLQPGSQEPSAEWPDEVPESKAVPAGNDSGKKEYTGNPSRIKSGPVTPALRHTNPSEQPAVAVTLNKLPDDGAAAVIVSKPRIPDPETGSQEHEEEKAEPVKITIEYIAGNPGKRKQNDSKLSFKDLYTLGTGLKLPDDYLGNFRSLKDHLFAFEFNKEKNVENQNKSK